MAFTTVLSSEPATITAGDSVSWCRTFSDYSAADGWVLTYSLVKDGKHIPITAAADGADHLVELTAAITALYTAGVYSFQAYVTSATLSERYKVDQGTIEILADFAQATTGLDSRTHARKMVDALQALIDNKANSDQLSYSIAGRSITKLTPSELTDWLEFYESRLVKETNKEKQRRGKSTTGTVKVRF